MKRLRRLIPIGLLIIGTMASAAAPAQGVDAQWVVGKWELTYDPDGAKKDWLEFKPNGDVISVFPDGERVLGLYIVTPDGVKAVFTYKGKDVIMIFHVDEQHRHLRIVTSRSGRESIYTKLE
ncbi:MAG: hypothetical protein P8009_03270 [Gammaproteobacteria bacterium]